MCRIIAIDIGLSVSLVAVVECGLPLFIMLLSIVVLKIPKKRVQISQAIRASLALQTSSLGAKVVSLGLISVVIFLVYS